MPSKIDPAIVRALSATGIDISSATISTHGGSGFASTYKITIPASTTSRTASSNSPATTSESQSQQATSIFVKTSKSPGAKTMFEGEHQSLNAIYDVAPNLCPRSFASGALDDDSGYFLATEFLDLGLRSSRTSSGGGKGSELSLAQKLATLHTTPAPIPDGHDSPVFGFPVTTCCGDTPQDNTYSSSWATFFGERRLIMILERSEKNNGSDTELRNTVERAVETVVPRLLGDGHLGGTKGVQAAVCHGDLWSGNKGSGVFVGRQWDGGGDGDHENTGGVEEVVFDPSAVWGHSEYDLGIMNMFGGFSSSFFRDYHALCPKTEPVDEYDDRLKLYEAYHHLNHHAIFGGGYKGGAMRLLKGLLKKYGVKR